jgi:hypothetical protein
MFVVTRKYEEIVSRSVAKGPGQRTSVGNRDTGEFKEINLE